ncbi:glycosyltransferase family 20 protein [Myriangium duriaei CBS 260.36]|uniref:Trehalose-6-phosphate synthase n=1 Tax=Myriangium duriaei CBS 260.36 TaxID=1168546 RepID=A0A9P4J7Y0_9PEZI|nr:glycosyltransferase family 20 protein [Myriangium duriaei CBS 260.36]
MSSPVDETDSGRLILISNRLPITIKRSDRGEYTFNKSSGGLVSGISGLIKSKEFLWYGWAGLQIPEKEVQLVEQRLRDEHSAFPVFFDDDLADRHYNGFSNEILWALLHYHPGAITFDESAWTAYKTVNQLFADRIAQDLRENDLVWIHDYHLMLLPAMVREKCRENKVNVKIGWFLHTPWPSSEIFRVLPVRREILEGVLQSDLIGFHTYDYARHFLSSCNRLLVASTTPNSIKFEGRSITVGAFPIGIDPEKFTKGLQQQAAKDKIAYYRKEFGDVKLIIGCDRLDYIKGVPHKLHTFQYFLEQHPEMVGKVKLLQIAIPSREDVDEYRLLKNHVNELVGQINGRFGDMAYNPVHLKHTSVSHDELMALFALSDVCLVASTRDGMNLVAYEYVACQEEGNGVLVLSEFAGCAQSFADGSVICNPWDIQDMSTALYTAVTMGESDKKVMHDRLFARVSKYTSSWWGESFINELVRVSDSTDDHLRIRRSTLSRLGAPESRGREHPLGDVITTRPGGKVVFE